MEQIKEKLLKIKRLAERGEFHEAVNAKRRLEELLLKYSLTLSDLEDNDLRHCEMNYHDSAEMTILLIIMSNVIGNERAKQASYNPKSKTIFFDATSYEFAEISAMFSWHSHNYKQEKKKMLHNLEHAYLIKQNLHFTDAQETKKDLTEKEIEQIIEAIKLSQSLSDNTYHKQLKDGKDI